MMQRVGWTPDSFAVGDVVSIDVNPTRNVEGRMARGVVIRPRGAAPLPFRSHAATIRAATARSCLPAEKCDLENARRNLEER
jgi:hypothetical protein